MRRFVPGRAFTALALLTVLALPAVPTAAAATAHRVLPRKAPVQRTVEAGGLAHLWNTWIQLWGKSGAGLDPNGGAPTGGSGSHGASPAGDTGSGLDPDGK
jgi:hypothetical protein